VAKKPTRCKSQPLAFAPSIWYLAGQVELPRRIRLLLLLRDGCALLPTGDCNQLAGAIQTERGDEISW
jgi:hypothetical protein